MAEYFELTRFTVNKRQDLTMSEVYQEIGKVGIPLAVLGTYEYGFSITHTYDQANLSEYLQFSIDGGTVWTEFVSEPSDVTNRAAVTYTFYKEGVSGDLWFTVRARKEAPTGIMIVEFVDVWMRRVK